MKKSLLKNRVLALVLSVMMVIGIIPAQIFAEGEAAGQPAYSLEEIEQLVDENGSGSSNQQSAEVGTDQETEDQTAPNVDTQQNSQSATSVEGAQLNAGDGSSDAADPEVEEKTDAQNPEDVKAPENVDAQNSEDTKTPENVDAQNPEDAKAPENTDAQNPEDVKTPENTDAQNPEDAKTPENADAQNPEDAKTPENADAQNPEDVKTPENTDAQNPEDVKAPEDANAQNPEDAKTPENSDTQNPEDVKTPENTDAQNSEDTETPENTDVQNPEDVNNPEGTDPNAQKLEGTDPATPEGSNPEDPAIPEGTDTENPATPAIYVDGGSLDASPVGAYIASVSFGGSAQIPVGASFVMQEGSSSPELDAAIAALRNSAPAPTEEVLSPKNLLKNTKKALRSTNSLLSAGGAQDAASANTKVALSRTFDLSILDENGNPVQPADGSTVTVAITMPEIANSNLDVNVYHFKDTDGSLSAEKLPVLTRENDTLTVETTGFSTFTVEFTYEGKQYVLEGTASARLDEVLASIGITGNIEDAIVSDSTLFEAYLNVDGNWYVYANQPFTTNEWMKVTVDGIVYEIVVTDSISGTTNNSNAKDFAKDSEILTIVIKDLAGITPTVALTGDLAITSDSKRRLGTTNKTIGAGDTLSLNGSSAKITYPKAAKTSDGIDCDVIITISDIKIYGDTRAAVSGNFVIGDPYKDEYIRVSALGDYITSSVNDARYGFEEKITVSVVPTGETTPVDGTFALTVHGLNTNRTSHSTFSNIVDAGNHYSFSEYITVDGSTNDIVFNADHMEIKNNHDIVPKTINNPGDMNYGAGVVIVAKGSAEFTAHNGGGLGAGTNYALMPRDGINHPITSFSGYGGKIELWTSGQINDSNATKLDGGTVASPRTYVVPAGKTVDYLLTPEYGYHLGFVEYDGTIITAANSTNLIYNNDGTYTFRLPSVGNTHHIKVSWQPDDDPEFDIRHAAMEPGAGGSVVHTSLQSQAVAAGVNTTSTLSKNGTAKIMGSSVTPPTISGYTHFTFALGYSDTGIPSTFYAKSDNLALRYSAYGEYQYCVNFTGGSSDTWETWSVLDDQGDITRPTVYAIYTKDITGDEQYVYTSSTVIARNTTDPDFVDPNTEISFTETIKRVKYTYTIKDPLNAVWNAGSTDYLTVSKTEEVILAANPHTHKPRESHGHALGYKTYTSDGIENGNDIIFEVYADYMVISETAPSLYKLTDILKKHGDQRGTVSVAADGSSGTFTIYTAGTNENAAFTVTRFGNATDGYIFTAAPESAPTDTQVEFINTRETVELTLRELLFDDSLPDDDTHDFAVTVRAFEKWTSTNWQGTTVQSDHYSMLGTHTITAVNNSSTGVDKTITVPKGANILLIERFGVTLANGVKTTDYDTTIKYADGTPVTAYRPLDKEYIVNNIEENKIVVFTNTLKPRIVTVKKTLEGGDLSKEFSFTATLKKSGSPVGDYQICSDVSGNPIKTDSSGKAIFTLSGNGSVGLNVPYGADITVVETTQETGSFTTAYSIDNAAAVAGTAASITNVVSNHEMVFTNTSIFSVHDGDSTATYEFYLDSACSSKYNYNLATNGDTPVQTYRQILREGSVLVLPQQPKAPSGQVFQGWFKQSDNNEFTDFGKTATFGDVDEGEFKVTKDEIVKLYAKFAEVRYVVFHENKALDSNNNVVWPVYKTVAVEKDSNGKFIIDLSAYEADSDDMRQFQGWADSVANAEADPAVILTNGNYDFTSAGGNLELYPAFIQKYCISFYTGEAGTGAPYIASELIEKDDPLSTVLPPDPSYRGYVFSGWYFDEALTQQVIGTETVTEDKTLYAKWELPNEGTYKIVVWLQDPDDKPGFGFSEKNWQYKGTYTQTHTFDNNNDANNIVTPTENAARSAAGLTGDTNFVDFFVPEPKMVEPDGSTVIDVYFSRAVYTVIIKKGSGWNGKLPTSYVPTTVYSGELYGEVNGNYERIYRQMYGWTKDSDGTVILSSDNPTVYNSNRTNNSIWSRINGTYGLPSGTVLSNTATAEGIQGYLYDGSSFTPVHPAYGWFTGSGDPYDINNGAYLKNEADVLATYTGLYQGHFDRMEKITPLLDTNNDGQADYTARFTYGTEATSAAAPAMDRFDFSTPIARESTDNVPAGTYVSIDHQTGSRTWIHYAQTETSEIRLYFDYYRLPKGTVLSTFMSSLESLNNVTTSEAAAGIPGADIRDAKKQITGSSSVSKYSNVYYNGSSLGQRQYDTHKTSGGSWSRYSYNISSSIFTGYTFGQWVSFYHGNGTSLYGPDKFIMTKSSSNPVYSDGKIQFAAYHNNSGYNQYGMIYSSNSSGSTIVGTQSADALNAYYLVKMVFVPTKNNIDFVSGTNTVATLQVYTDWSLNDSTVKWDGNADIVSGKSFTQKVAYDTYLSKGKNLSGSALTDPNNENRTFAGWYYDEYFTKPFDPTRPVTENIQVFAKWDTKYYVVQIDPAGGVLAGGTDGGSTWFWPQHGDNVASYNSVMTRDYDEFEPEAGDTTTVYYYSNYQYRNWGGTYNWDDDSHVDLDGNTYNLNNYTNPPHTATYGTDSSKPNDGKMYREMPGLWKLDYWKWEELSEDGQTVIDFGFDAGGYPKKVASNLRLTAYWKKESSFTIRFEVGNGKFVTMSAPFDQYYGDETGFNPDTDNAFDVPGAYLDGSTVTIAKAAAVDTANNSVHFLGWKVKGSDNTIYKLGDTYTVSSHDADANTKVITFVAQYGSIALTSLRYDANGGKGKITDVIADGLQIWDADNNSLDQIELNDTVTLSSGVDFSRVDCTLIGWSKEKLSFSNSVYKYDTASGLFVPESYEYNSGTQKFSVKASVPSNKDVYFTLGDTDIVVDGATGNVIYAVWGIKPVCKIVDTSNTDHIFPTLNKALEYSRDNASEAYTGGFCTIQMLIDYTVPQEDKLMLNLEDKIVLTTATKLADITSPEEFGFEDTLSGKAPEDIGTAILSRGWDGGADADQSIIYMNHAGASLKTGSVIFDGVSEDTAYTGRAVYNNNSSAVLSADGSQFRNLNIPVSYIEGGTLYHTKGGAVYSAGSLTLKDTVINGNTGSGLAEGTANAALGSAVYVESGSISIDGGSISGCRAANTDGGAVNVGSSATVSFQNNAVVYSNFGTEALANRQKNVVLDRDSNTVINTTSEGLGTGAKIGVYVTGAVDDTLFTTHGEEGDPFGTYSGDANLMRFINDRNGFVGLKNTGYGTIIWTPVVKVHEGEEFKDFTHQTDPKISSDSAYTIRFMVTDTAPKLVFTKTVGTGASAVTSSVSLPENTTIIMRVDDVDYYYYTLSAAASSVPVSSFSKMGGGTGSISGSYTAQFIIDFSDVAEASRIAVDASGTVLNAGMGFGSADPEDFYIGKVTLVNPASFTAAESTEDNDLIEKVSVTASVTTDANGYYRANGGRASVWDKREMALVLTAPANLPLDASISAKVGGTSKTVYRTADGKFIIPLGTYGNYSNIQITLNSNMFPAAATEYEFSAKLMVANSLAEVSPVNGMYNGAAGAAATATLKFKSQAAAGLPSIKITTDKRAYQPGETVTFKIQTLNDKAYSVEAVLLRKPDPAKGESENATIYAETSLNGATATIAGKTVKGVDVGDGTFSTLTFTAPAGTDVYDSYRLDVKVKTGGGYELLVVPYYFLVVSQE